MLKKLFVYSILITTMGTMTACSVNQPKKQATIIQKQRPSHQEKTAVITKKQNAPVVYKKRRPIFRQVNPRRTTVRRHVSRRPIVRRPVARRPIVRRPAIRRPAIRRIDNSFANRLSNAALGRLRARVRYDGSYYKIAYPWGDVPQNVGVCTDVVIRSYRRLGIDLQQQVHNDMSAAFSAYPNIRKWGLSKPDSNIDHRRVYNLRAFFTRRGAALPVTHNPHHYRPGDLVTWMVGKDLPHIGIVVNRRSPVDPNRFMIVHNIAYGPQLEDVLFRFPITGHYRYTPRNMHNIPKPIYASAKRASRATTPKNHSINYNQLVAAAQLLGTHKQKPKKNPANKIKKVSTLTIANLSNREMQEIMLVK